MKLVPLNQRNYMVPHPAMRDDSPLVRGGGRQSAGRHYGCQGEVVFYRDPGTDGDLHANCGRCNWHGDWPTCVMAMADLGQWDR